MCNPIIQNFSFQFQFFTMEHYPPCSLDIASQSVKISETRTPFACVHFEEHLKTIWIPTFIPSLKIKVG